MKNGIFYIYLRRTFLVGIVLFGFSSSLSADFAHEYTVQAIRTLNFARFTEWSSNTLKTSDNIINICVLGEPIIQNAFNEVEKRPAGKKVIRVVHSTRNSDLYQCKVLYVSGLTNQETKELLFKLKSLPILTVGENEDFIANSGMVQLTMDQGTIKIIVNLKAVKRAGLSINSRVLRIAKVVYS